MAASSLLLLRRAVRRRAAGERTGVAGITSLALVSPLCMTMGLALVSPVRRIMVLVASLGSQVAGVRPPHNRWANEDGVGNAGAYITGRHHRQASQAGITGRQGARQLYRGVGVRVVV